MTNSNGMNFQDLMKFQIMSGIGSSLSGNHMHNANAHGGMTARQNISFYDMLMQFVFMFFINMIDDICKAVPVFITRAQEKVTSLVSRKAQSALENISGGVVFEPSLDDTSIMLDKRHNVNKLKMMRVYGNIDNGSSSSSRTSSFTQDQSEMNGMVDAVLAYIANLDNIPELRLNPNGQFMVSYKDKPIQITRDVYMRIDGYTSESSTGHLTSIKITLLSNTLSACQISNFVRQVYTSHQEDLKNSLGNNIYFFDQKIKDVGPPPVAVGVGGAEARNHRCMVIQTAPKNLSFTMTPFYSNKRFCNIFGTNVRKIQERVDFFLNNKPWYDRKGIPYQLGMLLSGKPGTGKTSIIRAIANQTKRHIVNVNFANITTASQLKGLFYNDKIVVYTDNSMSDTKSYYIPIEQRLYVLEEIDAIGDIVKQRTVDDSENGKKDTIPDELTLAEILTVLDGTMEVPGRMIIMTSNHPEMLDKALVRPGRIDLKVNFDNASAILIAEMFEAYIERSFPREMLSHLPDMILTPAEACEVLLKYSNNKFASDEEFRIILQSSIAELNDVAREKDPVAYKKQFMSQQMSSSEKQHGNDQQSMAASSIEIAPTPLPSSEPPPIQVKNKDLILSEVKGNNDPTVSDASESIATTSDAITTSDVTTSNAIMNKIPLCTTFINGLVTSADAKQTTDDVHNLIAELQQDGDDYNQQNDECLRTYINDCKDVKQVYDKLTVVKEYTKHLPMSFKLMQEMYHDANTSDIKHIMQTCLPILEFTKKYQKQNNNTAISFDTMFHVVLKQRSCDGQRDTFLSQLTKVASWISASMIDDDIWSYYPKLMFHVAVHGWTVISPALIYSMLSDTDTTGETLRKIHVCLKWFMKRGVCDEDVIFEPVLKTSKIDAISSTLFDIMTKLINEDEKTAAASHNTKLHDDDAHTTEPHKDIETVDDTKVETNIPPKDQPREKGECENVVPNDIDIMPLTRTAIYKMFEGDDMRCDHLVKNVLPTISKFFRHDVMEYKEKVNAQVVDTFFSAFLSEQLHYPREKLTTYPERQSNPLNLKDDVYETLVVLEGRMQDFIVASYLFATYPSVMAYLRNMVSLNILWKEHVFNSTRRDTLRYVSEQDLKTLVECCDILKKMLTHIPGPSAFDDTTLYENCKKFSALYTIKNYLQFTFDEYDKETKKPKKDAIASFAIDHGFFQGSDLMAYNGEFDGCAYAPL